MKWKNILPALLAGALVVTSVVPQQLAAAADAKGKDDGLIASWSFDDSSLKNEVEGGMDADAVVTGLGAYAGDVAYAEDRSGGQAVKIGDYGLKLNQKNIGTNFTVSVWLKPDGTISDNQSGIFLGYHSPEKWLSLAGVSGNTYKVWANGNGYTWTQWGTTEISSSDWHCMTFAGDEKTVKIYLDGELITEKDSNAPLDGKEQDIYLGVNNWDPEFTGLVDDVKIYNRTLSESEIYQLYDESSAEEILEKEGISVNAVMNMVVGRTETIDLTMSSVVRDADPVITFESDDTDIASVDENGTVTAVNAGSAKITTKVTLGSVTKEAVTEIRVQSGLEDSLVASFSFEDSLVNSVDETEASALITKLRAYSGEIQYAEGKNGKAVQLGDYGLGLNQKNLGKEYTVSTWLKPDGTLATNQVVFFLGYHSPEKWLALSGESSGTNSCKFWGNGGTFGTWTTLWSPTVGSDGWHNMTVSGKDGKVTVYLDGISLGTKDSNDPLDGENQDIYLGVNNWDAEFTGLVDEVQVYNIAMTEEEVQNLNQADYQAMLDAKLDGIVTGESILGKNESLDNVKYDLALPESADGLEIVWTSSDENVVSASGEVINPAEAAEVTLTATVTAGTLRASKEITVTAAALDRTELDELLEKAKAIDTKYCTEVSRARLENAVAEAEAADSFTKVDNACMKLNKAIAALAFVEEYVDPFGVIDAVAPEMRKEMQVGTSEQLLVIPDSVKDMVEVEYLSSDDEYATYTDGTVTALKEGKVTVTAIVTAKYDGYIVEYSTALDITGEGEKEPLTIVADPEDYKGVVGETAEFTVEATGEGLTYQWQYCNANSNVWRASSMEGSNTASIIVPVGNWRNGQKYRCVVTDAYGDTAASAAAALTVGPADTAPVIEVQPVSTTAAKGETVLFEVALKEGTGEGAAYQWEYCNASSNIWRTSSMGGNQTSSLIVPAATYRNGQKYRCVITGADGRIVVTDVAVMTVK